MSGRIQRRLPALVAAALVFGCTGEVERPNVLLVSIDTLRADALGSYGAERPTSPRLDELASRSVRYERAFAPAPWTLPSHVGMLTGTHPARIGISGESSVIPAHIPNLAQLLAVVGYQTAAFVDSLPRGFVGAARGFGRGFDTYAHAPHSREPDGPASNYDHDVGRSVDAALDWLDGRDASRPFLLFLHTKVVHTTPHGPGFHVGSDSPYDMPGDLLFRFLPDGMQRPWRSPEGVAGGPYLDLLNALEARGESSEPMPDAAALRELRAMYDAGVAWVDRELGRLLDGLAQRGLDGDTLVIVTSDHGEAFLERRFLLHWELHDPVLRVPLLVYDPSRRSGRVVTAPVSLLDVVPSILERVSAPASLELDGRPLPTEEAEAAGEQRPFFGYREFREDDLYRGYALREGRWKLVQETDPSGAGLATQLYDTRADPAEQSPLSGEAARRARMAAELEAWRREISGARTQELEIDAETRRHLEALGYAEPAAP